MKMKFFDICKKLSAHSDHHQHRLGACIVKGNKIISLGFNQLKTHTKSSHPYKSLHAEISAIIKSKQNLNGCSIYVYRERRDGSLARSFPCSYCLSAIKACGITTIFYSDYDTYKIESV